MRIIKFRAFQQNIRRMWSWQELAGLPMHDFDRDDITFMQFTGLKDKNGKEIYENDYLEDWYVVWGNGKYVLQNISTSDIIDCNETTTNQKEVTGNSYEHPREHTAMASDL